VEHVPWWLDQLEVVIAIIMTVFGGLLTAVRYGTRWTTSIEKTVESVAGTMDRGFAQNHADHGKIIDKLENHTERIAHIEATCALKEK
jgi:hypothetical protein